jgi:hypothetical protein
LPGWSYPTNDKSEFVVIVEDVDLRGGDGPLDAYTQHPATGSGSVAAAILTSESPARGDGTRKAVRRVYETLPGPWIPGEGYDAEQGPVEVKHRRVRTSDSNVGAVTETTKTSFAPAGESSLVSIETVETWGAGLSRAGQLLSRSVGVIEPYVERVEYYANDGTFTSQGNPNCEATPHGVNSVLVREFVGGAAFETALLAKVVKHETTVNLDLPPVLLGITVTYSEHASNGNDAQTGSGITAGTSYSEQVSVSSRSSGSGSLGPQVSRPIKEYNGKGMPGMYLAFFIKGTVTRAAVLTRLAQSDAMSATVNALPQFDTEQITLHITAREGSVSANASASEHQAASGGSSSSSTSSGSGHSYARGGSNQEVTIGPTLHQAITIANPSRTLTVSATAGATVSSGGGFTGATAGVADPQTLTLTADVKPSFIPATTPSGIPLTGYYMLPEYDVDPWQYVKDGAGNTIFQRVVARVVDMAYFAKAPSYLAYLTPSVVYHNGATIEPNPPVFYGGIPTSYSCNNLATLASQGFSFDTTTGIFSGTTATTIPGAQTYTVTATNAIGSITGTVVIEVTNP